MDNSNPAPLLRDDPVALNDLYTKTVAVKQQGKQATATPTGTLQSVVHLEDDDLIRIASNAQNGEKIRALLAGQWQQFGYPSQSEADIALCNEIAPYAWDEEQLRRIFRRSGLYRETWEHKPDANRAFRERAWVFGSSPEEDFGGVSTAAVEPALIPLSGIQSVATKWLWHPYIPLGKITLMEADPGTGKTYLSLSLAAVVSSGGRFYGEPETVCRAPANVIYQTAEDGVADTIKPRLESMIPQPNFDRIFIIDEEQKGLTLLDQRIETTLQRVHPALFILDPLQAYLGATVDMHRANEVRPVLAKIARLAEKYECAFLIIMHMNKDSQGQALYRALGSIDIPAVARSMIYLGKNPNGVDQRIMCHEKSSLATHGSSLLFRIVPEFGGIVFEGTSDMSADDVLHAKAKTRNKPAVTLASATQLLEELIGEKGFCTCAEMDMLQESSGISVGTISTARKELALQRVAIGRPPHRMNWWLSPEIDKVKFIEAHKPPTELHENRPP